MFKQLILKTIFCLCIVRANYPSAVVNQGILVGKHMKSANGRTYSAFLSIPYAESPVGKLRFQSPIPAKPWEGQRNASVIHPMCLQPILNSNSTAVQGSEDCLYLNVFTPKINSTKKASYAVMIFIHGGAFTYGSAIDYKPDYLIDYDVIIVTVNYRLGVLGFFSTGDEIVPGNNGLKDQSLAIKWVYNNIKHFGGNPNRITLFGESSGAASTHLQLFSPLSKGLFKRIISQSGTAFCMWALGKNGTIEARSKKFANFFNCSNPFKSSLLKCLQKVDTTHLTQRISMFNKWDLDPMVIFGPVVEVKHEGAFLSDHPINIIKSKNYQSVPWITGINAEEGGMRVLGFLQQPKLFKDLDERFNEIMSILFEGRNLNYDRIRKFYFGNKNINNETTFETINLYTDVLSTVCANTAVKLHLKYSNHPIYYYAYGYKHPQSQCQDSKESTINIGTCHGDELLLLFPLQSQFKNKEMTIIDKHVSRLLNTMWTNFAKTGNPTPALNSLIQTKWEPVTTEDLEYSYIGSNIYSAKSMFYNRKKFWEDFDILEST